MQQSIRRAARRRFADIAVFSGATRHPLRVYQAECARAIVRSTARRDGKIFTVMFARQMGKNETSAQLEAYLMALYARPGGTIVKGAPSFRPQLITSVERLRSTLERSPLTRGRWHSAHGYMVNLGRASTVFLSAGATAKVVGATASLLLEVDEAQDVDPEKYDREFRPMASSTNATTVLYGTAWHESSLLERQRRRNLEWEESTGERLHFEYSWQTLARLEESYRRFVEGEIARLGEEHPTIRTQYLLLPLSDAGRLFSAAQRAAMEGSHERTRLPLPGETIVAGIDLAGADEEAEDAGSRGHVPRRDSTVVTIARVRRAEDGLPDVEVLDHVWWTGREQVWQYERLLDLTQHWNLARVAVDASGIGAGIAAFLRKRLGERVDEVVFSAPVKSDLAYRTLALLNTGRLHLYREDGSAERAKCIAEIAACRHRLRAGQQIAWEVPPAEGHDDFVASLALCCRAAGDAGLPAESGLVRARQYDADERW